MTLPTSSPTDTSPTSAYGAGGVRCGGRRRRAACEPPGAPTGPGGAAPPGYGAGGYWPAGYCPPGPAFRGCCGAVTGSPRARPGSGSSSGSTLLRRGALEVVDRDSPTVPVGRSAGPTGGTCGRPEAAGRRCGGGGAGRCPAAASGRRSAPPGGAARRPGRVGRRRTAPGTSARPRVLGAGPESARAESTAPRVSRPTTTPAECRAQQERAGAAAGERPELLHEVAGLPLGRASRPAGRPAPRPAARSRTPCRTAGCRRPSPAAPGSARGSRRRPSAGRRGPGPGPGRGPRRRGRAPASSLPAPRSRPARPPCRRPAVRRPPRSGRRPWPRPGPPGWWTARRGSRPSVAGG